MYTAQARKYDLMMLMCGVAPQSDVYALTQDCGYFPSDAGLRSAVNETESVGVSMPIPFGPMGTINLTCVKTPFVRSDVETINRRLFCSYKKVGCRCWSAENRCASVKWFQSFADNISVVTYISVVQYTSFRPFVVHR